ncbi:MAG: hypothetical protein AAF828_09795, partial [Bacteroidota bacterium]
MDILILLSLLLSNPIINNFSEKLEVSELKSLIENPVSLEYAEEHFLKLNAVDLFYGNEKYTGEVLLSSSKRRDGHLVYFKTSDGKIWNILEEYVHRSHIYAQIRNKNHVFFDHE